MSSSIRFTLAAVAALAVSIAASCGAQDETPDVAPTSVPVPTSTAVPIPTATSAPAASAATTVALAARTEPVENLPMYLGGLGRTGSYDTTPAVLGTVKWKFKGFPNTSGSPVVANGVAYFGSGRRIFAVDAENGEEIWRFETDTFIRSSPAVSDDVVYIGSNDGHLYAVDAANGQEVWKFKTGGKVSSSPAVSDGVVFFGSNDKNLYAVDVATGLERWRFQTGDAHPDYGRMECVSRGLVNLSAGTPDALPSCLEDVDAAGVHSSPSVVGGAVYFGAADRNLYSIDVATGQERWRLALGQMVISSPAIADGVLYITKIVVGDEMDAAMIVGEGIFLAVDLDTGQEMWSVPLPGTACCYILGTSVSGGLAFALTFTASGGPGQLYVDAIDIDARRHLWRIQVGDENVEQLGGGANLFSWWGVLSVPSVADDIVYIGNGLRNFRALYAKTGDILWEVPTANMVNSTPFVADGVVYFTSLDGYLYAVE